MICIQFANFYKSNEIEILLVIWIGVFLKELNSIIKRKEEEKLWNVLMSCMQSIIIV